MELKNDVNAARVGKHRRWARLAIGLTLVALVAMAFTIVHQPMPTGRAASGASKECSST